LLLAQTFVFILNSFVGRESEMSDLDQKS